MSEAERIAGELTEAQRAAIVATRTTHRLAFASFERVKKCGAALAAKALARRETSRFPGARGMRETHHWGLTPLGLEVKRILEEKE